MRNLHKQNCVPEEVPLCHQPTSRLKELQREAFNVMPVAVNARQGTNAINHALQMAGLSQGVPAEGRALFEDELTEEVKWYGSYKANLSLSILEI